MILGIDPWVRKLGYALVNKNLNIVDSGILLLEEKHPTRDDQFIRIQKIYDFFEKFIKEHKISMVSIEKLFFTKFNQNNAEFVYGVRWALISLFLRQKIQIKEYTPIQLKKFVTWNSKAEKKLVQKCVTKLYGLKECPEFADAADALALAYIAWKTK